MNRFAKQLLGKVGEALVFLFLVFLGWGWDEWSGFFAEPARTGYLVVVLGSAAPC